MSSGRWAVSGVASRRQHPDPGYPPEIWHATRTIGGTDPAGRRPLRVTEKLIANLESQLDLNQRQIRAALEILGENNIPPERLAGKLVEIAERFEELQLNVASQSGDDLKITALKADAQRAIDAGDWPR